MSPLASHHSGRNPVKDRIAVAGVGSTGPSRSVPAAASGTDVSGNQRTIVSSCSVRDASRTVT